MHPILESIRARRVLYNTESADINNLPGFTDVVTTICSLIQSKHDKIVIYSDGDVDGLTSNAQLTLMFRAHGVEPRLRINRRDSGWGYVFDPADAGHVIFLLDLGTNDKKEVVRAKKADCTVICIDHHLNYGNFAGDLLLNPGGQGPFKNYCTSLLMRDICYHVRLALHTLGDDHGNWLPILGGLADQCDLSDASVRDIIGEGLARIRQNNAPEYVTEFLDKIQVAQDNLSCQDLSWSVVPMLNAPGRLGDPQPTLDLLLGDTSSVRKLQDLNNLRKQLVAQAIPAAMEQVDINDNVVIARIDCPPGVTGLVAGRLKESLGVPVLVCCQVSPTLLKGSVRLPDHLNFDDVAGSGRSHCLRMGGHRSAGGFSLLPEQWPMFKIAVIQAAKNLPLAKDINHELTADADVTIIDLNESFVNQMHHELGPFGRGYPVPTFRIKNASVVSRYQFGSERQHTSYSLTDATHTVVRAVHFNSSPSTKDRLDIYGQVKLYDGSVNVTIAGIR